MQTKVIFAVLSLFSLFLILYFAPPSSLLWKSLKGDCNCDSEAFQVQKDEVWSDLQNWRRENLIFGDGNRPRNIFFFRTSNDSLKKIEICAIFAAGWHNPDCQVKILSHNRLVLPAYLVALGNVRWEPLNLTEIFSRTPLEPLYKEGRLRLGSNPIQNARYLSNILRYALIFKQGGIYLDTDMILLRNLSGIDNVIAWNHQWGKVIVRGKHAALNGAFLAFERGHPYMWLAMWKSAKDFQPTKETGYFGPKMLTRCYSMFQKLRQMAFPIWPPVEILERDLVHPLMEYHVNLFIKPLATDPRREKVLGDAYMVHMWNHRMRTTMGNKLKFRPESMFIKLIAEKHCHPVVPTLLAN